MRHAIVAIAALATLAVAGQAAAHARLILGSPKAGATVAAPKQLKMQFSESIVAGESGVSVAGQNGAAVATGPLTLDAKDKRVVIVSFTSAPAPGAYKVSWHMKTPDGHKTEGDFNFKVK
jgi:copper resistance protein C